jgi:hypothetical protein
MHKASIMPKIGFQEQKLLIVIPELKTPYNSI